MKIRLGYVAIALNLHNTTSSGSVTFTSYNKLSSEEKKLNKLKAVSAANLNNLMKILEYNVQNNIHFYRITSSLIPLATHPEVTNWNYRKLFKVDFKKLGEFILNNEMRVDTHPNEFNVLNSIREEVYESTVRNLWFHVHLFQDMNYAAGKMVIHIGSSEGGKKAAEERLIKNYSRLPEEISTKLILENDDKTFTAPEVLSICNRIGVPMVLDVHHERCNNEGEALKEYIENIFKTWRNEKLPPKVHFSSPREGPKDRKHADFINPDDFISFIELCIPYNIDFDIMLEAKMKDIALIKLREDIKKLRPEWNWMDETTIIF